MSDEKRNYPPAVERTIEILNYLAENHTPISIKEISDILNIPHASAFRIVKCLAGSGFLRSATNQSDKYQLGYKLLYLSKMVFDGTEYSSVALPYMKVLAEKTNQACQLCVLVEHYIITLNQILPRQTITIIAKLGEQIPINLSASGKLLFSLLPVDKQNEMFDTIHQTFKQNTQHTLMDRDDFLRNIKKTKLQGYGLDIEEYSNGICCIAVPLYDYSSHPIAAIGLTGPSKYYSDQENLSILLQELMRASDLISNELGYSGNPSIKC